MGLSVSGGAAACDALEGASAFLRSCRLLRGGGAPGRGGSTAGDQRGDGICGTGAGDAGGSGGSRCIGSSGGDAYDGAPRKGGASGLPGRTSSMRPEVIKLMVAPFGHLADDDPQTLAESWIEANVDIFEASQDATQSRRRSRLRSRAEVVARRSRHRNHRRPSRRWRRSRFSPPAVGAAAFCGAVLRYSPTRDHGGTESGGMAACAVLWRPIRPLSA